MNQRPLAPEASALTTELRPDWVKIHYDKPKCQSFVFFCQFIKKLTSRIACAKYSMDLLKISIEETTKMEKTEKAVKQTQRVKIEAQFCSLGDRNCKRFTKLGVCQLPECPIIAKERRMAAKAAIPKNLFETISDSLDVDFPFSVQELEKCSSPLYVEYIHTRRI